MAPRQAQRLRRRRHVSERDGARPRLLRRYPDVRRLLDDLQTAALVAHARGARRRPATAPPPRRAGAPFRRPCRHGRRLRHASAPHRRPDVRRVEHDLLSSALATTERDPRRRDARPLLHRRHGIRDVCWPAARACHAPPCGAGVPRRQLRLVDHDLAEPGPHRPAHLSRRGHLRASRVAAIVERPCATPATLISNQPSTDRASSCAGALRLRGPASKTCRR
jgi:hypothetical protein